MKPKIEITKDGSSTLVHHKYNAHYHSTFGAIEESDFVYINTGLLYFLSTESGQNLKQSCSVLELGFGTGLNAFNTLLKTEDLPLNIHYLGIETDPVPMDIISQLNYPEQLLASHKTEVFKTMHQTIWEQPNQITKQFVLEKRKQDIMDLKVKNEYNVIYFDAFGPAEQPELWTESVFKRMFEALQPNGVLMTYCAQGAARRAMQSAGFTVTRLPGPPSKRHILRAIKSC
ncbi:tRNA (5-methylaminomethyl-2-thiouridine)(34)-methyltransferase MnmD [Olleya sp. YSTF-M6]|uniref:tRNA (5-methylaminomethyl-2-thiouridine)(34)-methyltransferase MnmD n=1 Tax=Olleya sediminilitoris TaxID=2795739 RepID=A0ABS1WP57_9FLAO|nr:tRNA (5-methylaminomethyl-2-thiouridine)(34)-methyltransferase MnmD [Olleya sediminilitoris]MBL7560911.1 tRNA (5-methylaminomethyl-2-thiouridine)(34)-methyltransferase MnmD [Olleya sediminilitoris]